MNKKREQQPDILGKAVSLEKEGNIDEAIDLLSGLDQGSSANEHIYYALGRMYREVGRYEDSIDAFDMSAILHPDKNDSFFNNKILNEKEISSRATVLKSKPRGMGVVLTTKCNLRCIMCNSWNTPWQIPDKLLDDIVEHLGFLERIMWLGGEVFLFERFSELFDRAVLNQELHQTIVTDGLLIDSKWAAKIVRSKMNLIFSIDGFTEQVYEKIRKGAKYSRMLEKAIMVNDEKTSARNNGTGGRMTSSINFVAMKSNYPEIDHIADFAARYGFDSVTLTPVDYVETEENIFLMRNEKALAYIESSVREQEKKAREYGIEFNNWLPGNPADCPPCSKESADPKEVLSPVHEDRLFCLWPWQHLFIDILGQVKPHCLCLDKVGNISDSTIDEIWNNSKMQIYRQAVINRDLRGLCNKVCLTSSISRDCMGLSW